MGDPADVRNRLSSLVGERIVVLDGAWGVLLQGQGLTEEEFRGERFRDHDRPLKGDPDLLNITRPEIVSEIHRAYLDAGADITTTNTFTATSIGQRDYGLQDAVFDMNVAGARLATEAAAAFGDRLLFLRRVRRCARRDAAPRDAVRVGDAEHSQSVSDPEDSGRVRRHRRCSGSEAREALRKVC